MDHERPLDVLPYESPTARPRGWGILTLAASIGVFLAAGAGLITFGILSIQDVRESEAILLGVGVSLTVLAAALFGQMVWLRRR